MWILSCDDANIIGNVRLWLKPGSRYVLGRGQGSPEVNVRVIGDHKSISRAHLALDIGSVGDGDGVKLTTRSRLTVTDRGTKHGTRVNGEDIKGTHKVLDGEKHKLKLGKCEAAFRIEWCPVVLSVSLTTKDRKDKNVMVPYRSKVEALDVKTIGTFHPATTHVVASKRNTAIGLQALVNGRFIVTTAYLDAIAEAAATPHDDTLSPLERDFDQNWPRPEGFLPPAGNEPIDRGPEAYQPDLRRKNLFNGWTFIFCEKAQFENFLGPITDSHGKLERFDIELRKTQAEDVVDFVHKRSRETEVAVVRFRAKKDPDWENALSERVQELLGVRLVEQNEFLGIILTCDTSTLRRPLEEESFQSSSIPGTSRSRVAVIENRKEPTKQLKELEIEDVPMKDDDIPVTVPIRRAKTRRQLKPSFDPFAIDGDEFLPPPTMESSALPPTQHPLTQAGWTDSNDIPPSSYPVQPTQIEPEVPLSSIPPESSYIPAASQTESRGRKRSVPPENDDDENLDVMDLLPGANFVKRRKLEEEEDRACRGADVTDSIPESNKPEATLIPQTENAAEVAPKTRGRKGKQKVEDAYTTKARKIREEAEQAEAKAKAEDDAAMEGVNVESMKNLAIVEVMEVKPRTNKPVRDAYGDEGSRWNDRWNGRKDFKKFKRAGRGASMRTMRGTVMVNLVEHKSRDYGIGDGYWIDNEENPARSRSKSQSQRNDSPAAATPYVTAREQPSQRAETQTQTQTQGRRNKAGPSTAASQNATASTAKGTKRVALSQGSRAGAGAGAKKQRTLQIRSGSGSEESSDSEDELKFRGFQRGSRRR